MDLFNLNETEGLLMVANSSESESHWKGYVNYFDLMEIVQLLIAPFGIIGNLTVIVVFLNHRKLRSKIPNRFIINQVRNIYITIMELQILKIINQAVKELHTLAHHFHFYLCPNPYLNLCLNPSPNLLLERKKSMIEKVLFNNLISFFIYFRLFCRVF